MRINEGLLPARRALAVANHGGKVRLLSVPLVPTFQPRRVPFRRRSWNLLESAILFCYVFYYATVRQTLLYLRSKIACVVEENSLDGIS